MRFDIITLFPELFAPFMQCGVTRRAYESGQVQIRLWQLRDFAAGHYKRVDDRPYGGGPGMLMLAEPLALCVEAIWQDRADHCPVVLFSPLGEKLDHALVSGWAQGSEPSQQNGAILVCGRYEGLDQRFIDTYVTQQISLGDFVLSGGEIAAMALLDAIARLQTGVLGDQESHAQDSFNPVIEGQLDCPHYTRPEIWRGQTVPEVLLSGDHSKIAAWRQQQRSQITQDLRPDLLKKPATHTRSKSR